MDDIRADRAFPKMLQQISEQTFDKNINEHLISH